MNAKWSAGGAVPRPFEDHHPVVQGAEHALGVGEKCATGISELHAAAHALEQRLSDLALE